MEANTEIKNAKTRIDHIEDVLSSIAAGQLDLRINSDIEDDLTGVEQAINLLIDDLTHELKKSLRMKSELEEKLNKIQRLTTWYTLWPKRFICCKRHQDNLGSSTLSKSNY